MQIAASHEGIETTARSVGRLAAAHEALSPAVVAAVRYLPPGASGSVVLDDALDAFGQAWSAALDRLAEDARTVVALLGCVDARYADTELLAAASFGRTEAMP